eukprot:scaffold2848_cov352-Pavlova_lutheri.AAC.23
MHGLVVPHGHLQHLVGFKSPIPFPATPPIQKGREIPSFLSLPPIDPGLSRVPFGFERESQPGPSGTVRKGRSSGLSSSIERESLRVCVRFDRSDPKGGDLPLQDPGWVGGRQGERDEVKHKVNTRDAMVAMRTRASSTFHGERRRSRAVRGRRRAAEAPWRHPTTKDLEAGRRLRVAVDVDEVLGRFVHSLNAFVLEAFGESYDESDYHIYRFADVWNCSAEESNHRVHAFFASKHFCEGVPPIPGAKEALARIGRECELLVVTSRQHVIQQQTIHWIDTHYPGIFREIHFGNHYALEGTSKSKSQMCKELGAHVLVDDNPSYAVECAHEGIDVLLFDWNDHYPWCKVQEGIDHPRITKVTCWDTAEAAIRTLSRNGDALNELL